MKYLFIFLLVSTTVYSQNYHYAVDEAKEKATPDTTAPTSPINLIVSNITQTTATLNWKASTDNVGVVIYRVYNDGTLLNSTENPATSYTLTGLSPATDYNITIRAVDAANNESINSNNQLFTTNELDLSGNQPEEVAYFDCYLLPISQKSQLQQALNTYGCVRLEEGDYGRGTTITMTSNQSLYGHTSHTLVPNINIASGSSNVWIESVQSLQIEFLAGATITNCTLKSISGDILGKNIQLEDNLFVDIGRVEIDNSVSGYMRNNRVYRQQVHTISPQLVLNGNNSTRSYGNVHVWSNFLTPNGDGALLNNMGDITFIGLDSEGWNIRDRTDNAMFYARNMGNVKITDFGGGNGYCSGCETPAWDIQANNLFLFNKGVGNSSPTRSVARAGTNVFNMKNLLLKEVYNVEAGGIDFRAHSFGNESLFTNNSVYLNGRIQTSTITDPTIVTNLTNQILGKQHTPIARPKWETLPDPLGPNWASERVGKPDSRNYIQNLIDTKRIAELPEGIYYIGSTLNLNGDDSVKQGIIGKGTGKTVICGLTDDFPLITVKKTNDSQTKIHLAYLTLQGGSTGLYFPTNIRLSAFNKWKFLIFRNQAKGIHFFEIFGFDNNFMDHVSFVDCAIGIHNQGMPNNGTPEWKNNDLGYIDKTVYYKSQFINCGTALQVSSFRASNLNSWIECKFDNNGQVADINGNNYPSFVNCDFLNNSGHDTGSWLIQGTQPSLYNCNFYNNSSDYIFSTQEIYAEGCNFLDNNQLMSDKVHFDQTQFILNSTVNGDLGGGWRNNNGSIVNSRFLKHPELSKLIVNIKDNILTTIIDAPVNPYPQFFVKH